MKVFLNLHHFTEPVWFFEEGSFSRLGAEEDFAAYCRRCAEEYGDLVDFWITYNEPQVTLLGWMWGLLPPMKTDLELASRVLSGQLKGHAAARAAIKSRIVTETIRPALSHVIDLRKTPQASIKREQYRGCLI